MASTTHLQAQSDRPARERILAASRHLFSLLGYENTGIDAVCREARVTESEFTDNFSSKEDLLQAIFEESWSRIVLRLTRLQAVESPASRLKMVFREILESFNREPQTRDLVVLEGRRIHQGEMMMMTASYTDLVAFIDSLLQRSLPEDASQERIQLLRSSLMGAADGLLRDLVMRERFGFPADFSSSGLDQVTSDMVERMIC